MRDKAAMAVAIMLSIICCLLSLPGCGEKTGLTLRLSTWSNPEEIEIMERCIRAFEREYPGVRVIHESYPSNYLEKILTTMEAGNPPDVILLDSVHIPTFTANGGLIDLMPYVDRVGIDLNLFYPNVLEIALVEGKLYAFPKDFTPLVYFYNKELFDRTGTPYPREDWTWADFLDTCKQLTGDDDGDGRNDRFGTELNRELFRWQPWLWNGGGDLLSPDGTRAVGYFDSPESIRTFRFLTDLVASHKVTRRYESLKTMASDYDQGQKMFYSGRIGLFPSGHWWIPKIHKYMRQGQLAIGIAPFPRHDEESRPVTVMYESGFAVPKMTQHRKWAVRLAAFMSGEECQRIRAGSGLAISAMPHVAEAVADQDPEGLEETFISLIPYCRAPWGTKIAIFTKVEDVVPEIFDKVLTQGRDLEESAHEVAVQIEAVLPK